MRLAILFTLLCSVAFGLTVPHKVSAQAINAPTAISTLVPDMQSPAEHRGSTIPTAYDPDRKTGPGKPVRATPDQQFDIETTSGNGSIPVYSTIPLNANAAGTERVVIIVHGESRNAKSNWSSTVEAARMAAVTGTTLIVGPQFLVPQDIAARGLPATVLRWKMHDWSRGGPALSPVPVSGFEVLDRLLDHFADRTRYPDLRTVVLVGHSAGAQLVQRYAAVGLTPGSEHEGMREQARPPVDGLLAANRVQPQRRHAVKQRFARGEVIEMRRRYAPHPDARRMRIVERRAEAGMRFQLGAVGQINRVRGDVVDGGGLIVARRIARQRRI